MIFNVRDTVYNLLAFRWKWLNELQAQCIQSAAQGHSDLPSFCFSNFFLREDYMEMTLLEQVLANISSGDRCSFEGERRTISGNVGLY